MLLQENDEPLTQTTSTVNANTIYTYSNTTEKRLNLVSNDANKEIPNHQKSQHNQHPLLLTLTLTIPYRPVVTLTQLLVASDDSSNVPAAKPQAKAPVILYHSFSSAEPTLSMTESDSSNQLRLHTLEHVWMKWTEGLLAGNNSNIYVLLYMITHICDQIWQKCIVRIQCGTQTHRLHRHSIAPGYNSPHDCQVMLFIDLAIFVLSTAQIGPFVSVNT